MMEQLCPTAARMGRLLPAASTTRHNYVPYDEYQSLVGHVEAVDQTLQDANNNINILTTDFHNYMTNFTATRTTRICLLTTRDPS
jgi:hypothetical protein